MKIAFGKLTLPLLVFINVSVVLNMPFLSRLEVPNQNSPRIHQVGETPLKKGNHRII